MHACAASGPTSGAGCPDGRAARGARRGGRAAARTREGPQEGQGQGHRAPLRPSPRFPRPPGLSSCRLKTGLPTLPRVARGAPQPPRATRGGAGAPPAADGPHGPPDPAPRAGGPPPGAAPPAGAVPPWTAAPQAATTVWSACDQVVGGGHFPCRAASAAMGRRRAGEGASRRGSSPAVPARPRPGPRAEPQPEGWDRVPPEELENKRRGLGNRSRPRVSLPIETAWKEERFPMLPNADSQGLFRGNKP